MLRPGKRGRRVARHTLIVFALLITCLGVTTAISYRSPDTLWNNVGSSATALEFRDRSGEPLSATFQNRWNLQRPLALHEIPTLLKTAFILSEDKRFYEHSGVDWTARFHALYQWATTGQMHRGASSISEQVVRILNPRPRTLWSKWMETVEVLALESHKDKDSILEFYLNQVPYAANRRGVAQAADYYFRRDIGTLSPREMLTLVVLVRAPSRFDPYGDRAYVDKGTLRLGTLLKFRAAITPEQYDALEQEDLTFARAELPVEARHFLRFVKKREEGVPHPSAVVTTTLDAGLQEKFSDMLRERVSFLASQGVNHAALLVADHQTHEILAWATEGEGCAASGYRNKGCALDMVTRPRQPGSALKPFLYATALAKGWTAATLIKDTPYSEAVGRGLHEFTNYSHQFYGPVTLRQALANSLNIPALRTIRYVGVEPYLARLHKLGFDSLTRDAAIYDEGLALGNGEVTLFELVQAYATLANGGLWQPLIYLPTPQQDRKPRRVFSEEVATLMGNILSDPFARQWEFGVDSVLNFPTQTAVKTGTSTGYRDAWAVGYNYRYVVGVWMGNLNHEPMEKVTGSTGPSLLLRSIFQQLTSGQQTRALPLSAHLETHDICVPMKDAPCVETTEYFIPGTYPLKKVTHAPHRLAIVRPTAGLEMAIDPRIPRSMQKFEFVVTGTQPGDNLLWILDGKELARTTRQTLRWTLEKGTHQLQVKRVNAETKSTALPPVSFTVK